MKRIEGKPSLLSPSPSNLRLSNVRRGFKCPKVIYFGVCWPRLTSKWNWLQEKWIKPVLRFYSPPPMESPQNHQEASQGSVWGPRVGTSPLVPLTHQAPPVESSIRPHLQCPSAPSGGKYCCLPSGPCGCTVYHY